MNLACTMLLTTAGLLSVTGCRPALPPGKPVSQLTAEESAGRAIFQQQCARCHQAYSDRGLHGPGLLGVYRKPYLPSGAPADDERVAAAILRGRGMMPAFGNALDDEQLRALLKYLHSL
jgi:mono/diheme cytochrome c family protein